MYTAIHILFYAALLWILVGFFTTRSHRATMRERRALRRIENKRRLARAFRGEEVR